MKKLYFILIFVLMFLVCSCSKSYTVTFYDINNEVIDVQTIKKGASAKDPIDKLNLEGYIFKEWSEDFSSVKKNLEVKPIVEKQKFTVKFLDEKGNLLKEENVEYNSSATPPTAPTKEHFVFKEWNKNFENVKENLEISPIYEQTIFSVKFIDADGNLIYEQFVNRGEAAIAPTVKEIEGYKFVNWSEDFSNVTSNLEVKAIYLVNFYNVKFYDKDNNVLDEQVVAHGESAHNVEAPEVEGFKFVKWDKDWTVVKSSLHIYPIYEEIIYEVKFVDKFGNIIETKEVREGDSISAPTAPTLPYYTFTGWDQDFTKVTKNMTIKAEYTKDKLTYNMNNHNYWLYLLSDKYDINETILDENGIKSFNDKVLSDYSKTEVKDVLAISSTATSFYVKSMIDAYTNINKYTVYNHETKSAISSTEKTNILNNRNYDAVPSSVTVKYGIICDFAWLRSYPTNHYSNDYSMDRFQETTLNVGEGVAIYHISQDGNWYFIQAENYNGWVEKRHVAVCSYDELKTFLQPSKKLLVISDYEVIENKHVRMGQTFPLQKENDNSYIIKFPKVASDGNLNLVEVELPKSSSYHIGYLTYNYKNVFEQAFKLLGIDYSWGDKDKLGRDCSSTMNGIYKCFGFMMPRNTSNQVAIPSFGSKVSGLSNSSIQNYKPGTMIFTSSHVMLYLGVNQEGTAYLLHNTTSGNGECILQSLNSYGGSRINGVLKMQEQNDF